ncbi:MAG: hypothetical protein IJO91_01920 [Oscillospiraceae bacterium]|nr:hypothetical protein [Oscillospiraceae bacterium]
MDIKAKIDEIVEKVKNDGNFAEKFKNEPIKAVEEVLGVDLPDDVIQNVIDGVKSKVSFDGIADKIGGLFGGFGKKD